MINFNKDEMDKAIRKIGRIAERAEQKKHHIFVKNDDFKWLFMLIGESFNEIEKLREERMKHAHHDESFAEQRIKKEIRTSLKIGLSETFVAARNRITVDYKGDHIVIQHEELVEWVDKAIDSVGGK